MKYVILALLVWSLGAVANAGDAELSVWKASIAQINITPREKVFLAGYTPTKPYTHIETELFAKALLLEDKQGQRAVLVTSDLLGFPASVAEPICERIREKTGLKREQILLNSAHVHTGPALSRLVFSPPESMSAEDVQRTAEYTKWLQDQIVELVTKAHTQVLEPVRLSWGSGVVPFVMNRRQAAAGGIKLGFNPSGLADRTMPLLRVDGADGKARAVLFGAAVHNTTLRPAQNFVCGDYAGYAQAYVQERLPGTVAMFMLGLAGDADPYPHGSLELAKAHGETLGKEVCRVMETKLAPVRGPLRVAFDHISLPLEQPLDRSELDKEVAERKGYRQWAAKQMLAALKKGEKLPEKYSAPVAVWQFGEDITLVALPGEVVSDYVSLLENALGPLKLWLSAYNNDVFGYLPSARILAEGGYETRGLYSGGIGYFTPKVQDVLVEKVKGLAKTLGRQVAEEVKYKLGMTMEEAQNRFAIPHTVAQFRIDIDTPTEQERREQAIFYIDVPEEKLRLIFNSYKNLIKIEPMRTQPSVLRFPN